MDDQNNSQIPGTEEGQVPAAVPAQSSISQDEESNPVSVVKKQALEALLPLVDTIESAPEAKFEILMGALQSSPDLELLQKALAVAKQIEDPATKAEALVDVLTEADQQEPAA